MLSDRGMTSRNSYSMTGRSPKTNLVDIREFMNDHYNEPLSITQLAQMANISPKYFVDLFKKTFGQSAMDYLTDLRINRAKRYLLESEERFREIALKVGYKDEFYFSRKFKKEVGVSPSDFVKQSKRRIAACSSSVTGYLLALNIIPIAAPLDPKWTPHYYYEYRSKIKSPLKLTVPYTEWEFDANVAELVHSRPDVIVGTDQLHPSEQEQLKNIAPSLFVPTDLEWREQLRLVAQFVDREESAEMWLQQYDQRVQTARDQIENVLGDDKVVTLRIYKQSIHWYWNRGIEDVLYKDLNIACANRSDTTGNTQFTLDQLVKIDPERIMLIVCPEASTRAYWLALQHSAEWRKLKAVTKNHVYTISAEPWCEYSANSIIRMLDEAQLMFTGYCPNSFRILSMASH